MWIDSAIYPYRSIQTGMDVLHIHADQRCRHPIELIAVFVEHQSYSRRVSQNPSFATAESTRAGTWLMCVLIELLKQILADLPMGIDFLLQFSKGDRNHLIHILGNLPKRNRGAENHIRRVDIIA